MRKQPIGLWFQTQRQYRGGRRARRAEDGGDEGEEEPRLAGGDIGGIDLEGVSDAGAARHVCEDGGRG
eukprot:2448858-Prymnesium_polylepis.1